MVFDNGGKSTDGNVGGTDGSVPDDEAEADGKVGGANGSVPDGRVRIDGKVGGANGSFPDGRVRVDGKVGNKVGGASEGVPDGRVDNLVVAEDIVGSCDPPDVGVVRDDIELILRWRAMDCKLLAAKMTDHIQFFSTIILQVS